MAKITNLDMQATAALIRQALAEAFPGVKFNVRGKKYYSETGFLMGADSPAMVMVVWSDGPIAEQVADIAGCFQAAEISTRNVTRQYLDGKPVKFGADAVICRRAVSQDLRKAAKAAFQPMFGASASDNDYLLEAFTADFGDPMAAQESPTAARVSFRAVGSAELPAKAPKAASKKAGAPKSVAAPAPTPEPAAPAAKPAKAAKVVKVAKMAKAPAKKAAAPENANLAGAVNKLTAAMLQSKAKAA